MPLKIDLNKGNFTFENQRDKKFIYQDMYHILGQIAEQQRIINAAEEAEEKKDELEAKYVKLMNELNNWRYE